MTHQEHFTLPSELLERLMEEGVEFLPRMAEFLRRIFQAPDRAGAEALLKWTVEKYAQKAPRLSAWMEQAIPEGLTVFDFPASHRRRLRTNNLLERLHREVGTADESGQHLSQRSVLPAVGECGSDGDR